MDRRMDRQMDRQIDRQKNYQAHKVKNSQHSYNTGRYLSSNHPPQRN